MKLLLSPAHSFYHFLYSRNPLEHSQNRLEHINGIISSTIPRLVFIIFQNHLGHSQRQLFRLVQQELSRTLQRNFFFRLVHRWILVLTLWTHFWPPRFVYGSVNLSSVNLSLPALNIKELVTVKFKRSGHQGAC